MKILTRMGDSSTVEMTRDELRKDLEEGTEAAATKAKIPALTENEHLVAQLQRLFKIMGHQQDRNAVVVSHLAQRRI